jgi:hypothetical protein
LAAFLAGAILVQFKADVLEDLRAKDLAIVLQQAFASQ